APRRERPVQLLEHAARADVHAVDAEKLLQDGIGVDLAPRAGEGAEDAHRAARAQRSDGLIERARAADLDGDVDPDPACPGARRLTPGGGLAVVNGVRGPELLGLLALGGARRGDDDLRACRARELEREDRDAAGALEENRV